MDKNTLYVIGNGYDIANGLPTRYSDFKIWVEENYPNLYKIIDSQFNLNNDWSEFENKIADSLDNIESIVDEAIEGYWDYEDDLTDPGKADSDKSHAIQYHLDDNMIYGHKLEKLVREWISFVMSEHKPNIRHTNNNVINFNYTNYLKGPNVFHIHESISSKMSLHIGHSNDNVIERGFSTNISDFGNPYPDPKSIYKQLSKNQKISGQLLDVYLINKDIDKIIFFGFSFGKQDVDYFERLSHVNDIEFYTHKDNINKLSISNCFDSIDFIDSKKWHNVF